MKKEQYIIGVMSGSSLDGLDMAYCKFNYEIIAKQLHIHQWEIKVAETVILPNELKYQLTNATKLDPIKMQILDILVGQYIADSLTSFINKHKLNRIDLIASHGHTVVHNPEEGISLQIGNGKTIADKTSLAVINQFRNKDVSQGGQGAPVAPIADKYLFPGFDFYINLGGIVNISYEKNQNWFAYDISGANQILNALSKQLYMEFDDKGMNAKSGAKIDELYNQLNHHSYLNQNPPKSLDNQFVFQEFTKLALAYNAPIVDKLCTVCHHIAFQISIAVKKAALKKEQFKMYCTGGGAFNDYLISLIDSYCNKSIDLEIVIPEATIINFKEAALMALMGLLHQEQIPNVMASVTGATQDTINGEIHHPANQKITA